MSVLELVGYYFLLPMIGTIILGLIFTTLPMWWLTRPTCPDCGHTLTAFTVEGYRQAYRRHCRAGCPGVWR